MELTGEARLPASRDRVWAALNDPAILRGSIPGCEALDRSEDGAFTATVISKVGPIKARFVGHLSLTNIQAPRSYTLIGEGSGGAAGFAKAEIDVLLDAPEPQLTVLRYTVRTTVGGKLAQLGSRMIDAAARKSADDFFALFAAQISTDGVAVDQTSVAASIVDSSTLERITALSHTPTTTRERAVSRRANAVAMTPVSAEEVAAVLSTQQVKVWISDQIAVVTLNRPDRRNAMTLGMWRAFPAICASLQQNDEVRVVILTGQGADFCAGADISEFSSVRDDAAQATQYELAVDACCDAIAHLRKPTIAVVRGYCLGGGAHLAMSCDFRYSASDATYGIPAARLSIIYGVSGTRKLLSLVGLSAAKKILFGAQRFAATEALNIGFVDHVSAAQVAKKQSRWRRWFSTATPAGRTDPMADARDFARALVDNAPLSIAGAKSLLNGMAMGVGALDLDEAETLIAEAAASADYREGRTAFAERRPPRFSGR
jgi:enoyl-CoA hydratase/carnithine racemase/carbon monoxide dehydrogenase subunit G